MGEERRIVLTRLSRLLVRVVTTVDRAASCGGSEMHCGAWSSTTHTSVSPILVDRRLSLQRCDDVTLMVWRSWPEQ